jgi:Cof subfamily protein (haloacid dehalogenase superfamily)
MICCNGAHVLAPGGQELSCHILDPRVLDAVLAYATPRGIHVNAYTRVELLFLTRSPWAEEYERRLVTLKPRYVSVEEAKSQELIKVSLIDSPEAIQEHIKVLAPQIDQALARPTESEPEYLEFMHPMSNKGNGLAVLAAHLGIDRDRTAAIGDYLNDLEMLAWAGYSGAVSNAAEAVRSAADVIAPSNDEGGVGWFIDEILRHRRQ